MEENKENKEEVKEPEKKEELILEEKEEPKPEEKEVKEEVKEETYINKEEALEKLLQFADLNNIMIWMAATMSVIAAINSLTGPTVITKCLVFMLISLISLIIYKRRFKK